MELLLALEPKSFVSHTEPKILRLNSTTWTSKEAVDRLITDALR